MLHSKDIIFGRTTSQQSVLNIIQLLLLKVDQALLQKQLLLKVPMNAIEDFQSVAHCLISLDMHPYQRHPSQIKQVNDQPTHSLQTKIPSHQPPNRNVSINLMKRETGTHGKVSSSSHCKKRRGDLIAKEEGGTDYTKYSVEIDLGFALPTDQNEDVIRRKKEEEMNRKMEREEADLKKIMNRKKMDKEMMEALIKDKKQVVFTYDYDGLLLPVTKLEANKLPISHYEMRFFYQQYSYILDSGEPIVQKPPEPYQPKILFKGKKVKKPLGPPANDHKSQHKENSFEFSEFYKNFETTELAPGATLKFKGKQVISQTPIPNMEFLTSKTKQPQRIQQKHYMQFIKNGNLKRFQMEADDKPKKIKQIDSQSVVYEDSRISSFFKKTSKDRQGESIIINNSQLLKDLKMLKTLQINNTLNPSSFLKDSSPKYVKKSSKFSYINPIDEFNMSTVMAMTKKQSTQSEFQQKKIPNPNKKTSFAAIQRASTANKVRVRRSILNFHQS